ncbi:universal stress protein [Ginsengibacter hankyongi]|uniref:Universal stress protein n=1 Tax=Ginsengibacter hankyongi TaxID=2607284 RepID=A0A5J5IKL9_9BACT|nr:universal stress protein [Ginsengibacter hankyongi]KAA9041108.1 universal stress protein [Ginsengibacter hankyongi]
MKKILLAINAIDPDKNSLEFACYLGRLTNSGITGIFLENYGDEEILKVKPVFKYTYSEEQENEYTQDQLSRAELIEKNILSYKEASVNRGVNFSFHRDRGVPVQELISESRYADILVVDPATSFNKTFEGTPTDFIKNVLKNTECPAIVAPEGFEAIDEIIFTYDGSASSVFAIKQFTYIFPQLHDKKANVVHINDTGEWNDANRFKLKEHLKNYYYDLNFEVLKGNIYNNLIEYVFKKKNTFLVMGAYGRNSLSRFFKPSKADLIIKTIPQPIFIAHF